jgi:arginine utilization regulatory protein
LVLDEITALPWRLQARLVDVLDNHRLLAVGNNPQLPLDVRILATTREEGADAVASGKLRRDLYYRLQCLTLRLPPLRKRSEDTGATLHHWITPNSLAWPKPAPVAVGALRQACVRYPWPSNFCESEDSLER